jgi:hypothetical protein
MTAADRTFIDGRVAEIAGIHGVLLLVAVLAVFVILVIVYRSLLLPILVLPTAVFTLRGAIFLVWHLAKGGAVQLQGMPLTTVQARLGHSSIHITARPEVAGPPPRRCRTRESWRARSRTRPRPAIRSQERAGRFDLG